MYFVVDLSIPPEKPENTPYSVIVTPPERTIKEIQIAFLDDPATIGLRIRDHGVRPLLPGPFSPAGWIKTVGTGTMTIPADDLGLDGTPYSFTIEAYNTAGPGSNTDVQIRFVVVSFTLFQAVQALLQRVTDALLCPIFHWSPKEGAKP